MSVAVRSVGAPVERIEGREKVTGQAVYAYEYEPEGVAYAAIVTSSVARGSVRGIDAESARSILREVKAVGGNLRALRVALTGAERGPELWRVLAALPREETIRRIDAAL